MGIRARETVPGAASARERAAMDYEQDMLIGECPYTATPCHTYCGAHVDGKCSWGEPPDGVRLEECRPATPRAYYLSAIAGEVEECRRC